MNGGTVKLAQKKFSSLSNDFCIVFDKPGLTEITEYYAASSDESIEIVPQFNLLTLANFPEEGVVDFIAIVTESGEKTSFITKNGKERQRRQITVMDDSRP